MTFRMIIILVKFLTASAAIAQVFDRQILVSENLNNSLSRINTRELDVKAWAFWAVQAACQQMAAQEQSYRASSLSDLLLQRKRQQAEQVTGYSIRRARSLGRGHSQPVATAVGRALYQPGGHDIAQEQR